MLDVVCMCLVAYCDRITGNDGAESESNADADVLA